MSSASALLLVSHVLIVCRSENRTKVLANYFIWCFWCGISGVLENGLKSLPDSKMESIDNGLGKARERKKQQKLLLFYLIF